MVAEVCKRERSRSYVTDEKGENGRKGRVNNKSNYFKTASKVFLQKNPTNLCKSKKSIYLCNPKRDMGY